MGKIVFSNAHPDFLNKIKRFLSERKMPASTLEDLAAGMNHAEIGARIAEKWNFPEDLVAAIRFHHDPASAPPESKDLVSAVYLANMFCELETGGVNFDQLDPAVLANFGINSKKQIDVLLEKFSSGFKQESHP
jgi:HD-like signal output (HDOD) protein